jgi:hypothetical protein
MNRIRTLAPFCCLLLLFPIAVSAQTKATPSKNLGYSIQVERIESKVDGLPAEFSAAIYENLIEQLKKSGKFLEVLRSGDKRASNMPNVLTLKTTVEKFEEGSETKRAVTTVAGATKVFVHMQAVGSDGKPVAEKDADGSVRFFGTNLRATQNLASSMAKQLEAALEAQAKANAKAIAKAKK